MEEFEPQKKVLFGKAFFYKYIYAIFLGLLLILGTSYSITFFQEKYKIGEGSITTATLTVNYSNQSINATGLSSASTDSDGLQEFSKNLTLTNTTDTKGLVKVSLTRTSGLALTDLRYALIVNGAIQEIGDVPSDGLIYDGTIMNNGQ